MGWLDASKKRRIVEFVHSWVKNKYIFRSIDKPIISFTLRFGKRKLRGPKDL